MQLILIIAGIVGLVLPTYFKGQHPVAWTLIFIGIALIVIHVLMIVAVAKKVSGKSRNRRGF